MGQLSKTKRRKGLFFPGVEDGKERRHFFYLLQFHNQTHHRQSRGKKGSKEKPRALSWGGRGRANDASCVRTTGKKAQVSGLRRPHEEWVTVAKGVRSKAARPRLSVQSSPAGRCGGGAEERQGGRGTGRANGGGGRTSCTFPPFLSHSDSAEVRRAEAGNKGKAWGGERVGQRRAPG